MHTDKHGYLLPPRANEDLPRTLEGKGDSFWIDERTRAKKEEERVKRSRKGRTAAAAKQRSEEEEVEESDRSEDADVSLEESGVIDVVRVSEDEGELQWHEVIDAVLHVGGALAAEKQRKVFERRRKGLLHRKTPSTVMIEHIPDDNTH